MSVPEVFSSPTTEDIVEAVSKTASAIDFTPEAIRSMVEHFRNDVAVPEYLNIFSVSDIANHVVAFHSALVLARMSSPHLDTLQLSISLPAPSGSLFIFPDTDSGRERMFSHLATVNGKSVKETTANGEEREKFYMAPSIKMYRSPCALSGAVHVLLCFVHWAIMPQPVRTLGLALAKVRGDPDSKPLAIDDVSTDHMKRKPPASRKRYEKVVNAFQSSLGPTTHMYCAPACGASTAETEDWKFIENECTSADSSQEHLLMMAFEAGHSHPHLPHIYSMFLDRDMTPRRMFCEEFSNGCVVYNIYFTFPDVLIDEPMSPLLSPSLSQMEMPSPTSSSKSQGRLAHGLKSEAALLRLIPLRHAESLRGGEKRRSPARLMYVHAATVFAGYFASMREEVGDIVATLGADDRTAARVRALGEKLQRNYVSRSDVYSAVKDHPDAVEACYKDFKTRLGIDCTRSATHVLEVPTASLLVSFRRTMSDRSEAIFRSFLVFNANIIRTNFVNVNKAALSFRLATKWLSDVVPEAKVPHALYMVLASDFRGFHIRYAEIARGGIRFVRKTKAFDHEQARRTLFELNMGLAYTQQLKNKDIPEGGSKGVILSRFDSTAEPLNVFMRYLDAILDLLLRGSSSDETSLVRRVPIVDLMPDEDEILFFGPDEQTANCMQPASEHARARGYRWPAAITTGKEVTSGGVPHDEFGMTTAGVRVYVEQVIKAAGLDITKVRKFQTGGPDGDLGSNEIKEASEITVGVSDGSGVLYDPEGLNKAELRRLAVARVTVSEFNTDLLSDKGYFVGVKETNRVLPGGYTVASGETFRNKFFVNPTIEADLFVPCGGVMNSINMDNVYRVLSHGAHSGDRNGTGRLKYKYIVEGANLFVSHDARMELERAGVVLIKDSSANKGGVTSSSLEVTAALVFSPSEFRTNMCVTPDPANPSSSKYHAERAPPFYVAYKDAILDTIRQNALLEYHAIERMKAENPSMARCEISDALSYKILSIKKACFASMEKVLQQPGALRNVISKALPRCLIDALGVDTVIARMPTSYLHAIFCGYVASRYTYSAAGESAEFAFFLFLSNLIAGA